MLFINILMENTFKDFFPSHFSPYGTELLLKMFFGSVKLRVMF